MDANEFFGTFLPGMVVGATFMYGIFRWLRLPIGIKKYEWLEFVPLEGLRELKRHVDVKLDQKMSETHRL